jgi:thiamine-monophosphate kinase
MQAPGKPRKLREVGEFGLISAIRKITDSSRVRSSGLVLGVGDDTALWQPRPGRVVAVTTDMLIERKHFRTDWSDAKAVGHRALAVNLSDLASMGARPRMAVVSLGLKGSETDRWVYDFYRGMLALADKSHVRIAGGDIVHSPGAMTINVTAHGEVHPSRVLLRDTADVGDVIAVTGPLGLAAAGIRLLENDTTTVEGAPTMLAAHRTPQPRILHGILLGRAGVRCAMDLSDGLLGDLPKLLNASNVSAEIVEAQLPIPNSLTWTFGSDARELALRGGEDFELLFTAPRDVFERVQTLFQRCRLRQPVAIGTITKLRGNDGPVIMMRRINRRRETIEPGAFDHFHR